MTLTYDPNGPLARLGVLEEVAKRDCPSRAHYIFNDMGEVRGYFGNAFYSPSPCCSDGQTTATAGSRGAGQRGNLRIPRSELRSILLDALMSEAKATADVDADNGNSRVTTILWNKRLLSYEDRPMMAKLNQQIHSGKKNNAQQLNGNLAADQQQQQRPVLLTFDDGTTDQVDLLIGADGVNSRVARQYLSTTVKSTAGKHGDDTSDNDANCSHTSGPSPIGIFIILGISHHFHPLVDERGFHTLDGHHRLFTMPFQGSRLDDDTAAASTSTTSGQTTQTNRRTMWQLSFPVSSDEAIRLSKLSHEAMQSEALSRCGQWHEPISKMLKETPLETVWGTSLLDCDPQIFTEHRTSLEMHGRLPSRVVLLGDAAHSMSPFKGSGANRAMADGPLLANWLCKAKADSAVRGFMTEMAQRSGIKVRASREAATKLHSKDCWEWMAKQEKPANRNDNNMHAPAFHGVQREHVSQLLRTLKDRGVGASLGSKLDKSIRGIIHELNITDISTSFSSTHDQIPAQEMTHLRSQALEYASAGNISHLRQLSQKSQLIIPNACLHLAAKYGHVDMCRWLLSEVNLSCSALDANGKTPIDVAMDAGNEDIVLLLRRWMDQMSQSTTPSNSVADMSKKSDGSSPSINNGAVKDVYRNVEQQLRGIRSLKQLRALLQRNRCTSDRPKTEVQAVTHVLGCHLDRSDEEHDKQCLKALAEEHGAVLLRNFIPREVDQLALGAMALRPAVDAVQACANGEWPDAILAIGSKTESASKSESQRASKRIEEIKSQMMIPADAGIIVQTNFGPQMQSYSASGNNALKKRKIAFPLSRLRYINLGEWDYNWGERRYEKVKGAKLLPDRLVWLARRAHDIAIEQTKEATPVPPVSFDMSICNIYHLQRPSDRLGGHQDNVESNLSMPLVTVSLGAPGIFLLGGKSREDVPTAILLRAGDCMIMSGRSRSFFHGVPTILSNELDGDDSSDCANADGRSAAATGPTETSLTIFPELDESGALHATCVDEKGSASTHDVPSLDEMRFAKAFLTTVRMNMSIRQV